MVVRALNIGDRVILTRDIRVSGRTKGMKGNITAKYAPHWSTGCWDITVEFDDGYRMGLPYPSDYLEAVN